MSKVRGHAWERTDTHTEFWKENLKEKDSLEDLRVDGRCSRTRQAMYV
jgi:hypothetical protein